MIYLDNAATTMTDPDVLEAMLPYLTTEFGNPNSPHTLGITADNAVSHAREQVASLIGADPEQIVFTHSATDANHMVLDVFGRAIVSNMEHSSILHYDKAWTSVSNAPWAFAMNSASMEELMSVILVNNEIGDINDIKNIAAVCHENGMVLHTDATAAAGCMQIDVKDLGCDFMTFSSHKIHGPKGAAALYVIDPDVARDFEYGGTPDVPAIVGFGAACEKAQKRLEYSASIGMKTDAPYDTMAELFINRLRKQIDGVMQNKRREGERLNKIINLRIDGVDAETLVMMCAERGLMISTGAACNSHEKILSHVLAALALTAEQIQSSVRISFSRTNFQREIIDGADILADCVKILREAGHG